MSRISFIDSHFKTKVEYEAWLATSATGPHTDQGAPLRVLVMDCGSVTNPDCGAGNDAVAACMGVAAEDCRRGHKAAWALARSDAAFREYWPHVFETAGVPPESRTPERVAACEAALGEALSQTYPDTLEAAGCAKAAGLLIGMISNHLVYPNLFEYCAQGAALHSLVSDPTLLVVSQAVSLAKPDPKIFRLFYQRLAKLDPTIAPQSLLFLDDKEVNVAAAVAEGWQAVVYDAKVAPAGTLRRLLAERGVK